MRGEIFEVKKFLEEQIERYKIDLEKAEEMLKEFKEREGMVELDSETKQLIEQASRFEYSYNDVMTDLETNRKRLEYIKSQLDERKQSLPDDIVKVANPLLKRLRADLSNQEAKYAKYLAQGIPEDHGQMKEIREKIEDIKGQLKAEAENLLSDELVDPLQASTKLVTDILGLNIEIESGRVRSEALKRVKDGYDREMMTLPVKSLKLARLTRGVNLYSDLYIMLTKRFEEMRITEAGKMNNIQIIDRARPSKRPIKPNKTRNIIMGIIVGLGLGMGITLTIEFLDTTLKNPDEIEKLTRLSVVGAIPRIKASDDAKGRKTRNPSGNSAIRQIESRLITHFAPKSPVAEAYRTLRTNIQFVSPDQPIKTIMTTSSNPKEGKSTTIANLAIALAQMDTKVVLLDTDFRRPIVHSLFSVKREPGLTSVLLEQKQIEEVIHKTEVENLYVIPCGVIPPNPSELLGSNRMKEIIGRLKEMFDLVLFDSPPIIAVTDAAVLGSEVDGVVLVVQEGKTRRQDVQKAQDLLENVKARIIGVVLNIIDIQRKYGYYYYYYYYYYHDYYTYGGDAEQSKPRWWKRKKKA
jgi:tyrosine-protein kinase Etk/Wzc